MLVIRVKTDNVKIGVTPRSNCFPLLTALQPINEIRLKIDAFDINTDASTRFAIVIYDPISNIAVIAPDGFPLTVVNIDPENPGKPVCANYQNMVRVARNYVQERCAGNLLRTKINNIKNENTGKSTGSTRRTPDTSDAV